MSAYSHPAKDPGDPDQERPDPLQVGTQNHASLPSEEHTDHDHGDHGHRHEHGGHHEHGHTHGAVDPSLFSSERGIWAVKWSLVGLLITAVFQVFIVALSGSVALLADTIHNFGDGLTAIPLWIAFRLARKPATRRFTYGYGRVEDLAGLFIVLMILISAGLAAYESIRRLVSPQPVTHVWAVIAAALIGFIGNEAVAYFRIKIGKEIGSAALVADGYHARTDGLTSLAVLAGAIGVALGYPLADPITGLLITVAILKILWESSQAVFTRLLDGVDPVVVDELEETGGGVPGVQGISEARVRWLGHRMHAELNVTVAPDISVAEGHAIAAEVHHQLLHHLDYLSGVTVHLDPTGSAGAEHHRSKDHRHEGYPTHSH